MHARGVLAARYQSALGTKTSGISMEHWKFLPGPKVQKVKEPIQSSANPATVPCCAVA